MVPLAHLDRRFVVEDRAQSGGTEISSRRHQLQRVLVLTHQMPEPTSLAVQLATLILQSRGLSLSDGETVELLKTFAAAEQIGREG